MKTYLTLYVYVNGKVAYEKRGDKEIYFWYDSYGNLAALRCFGTNGSDVLVYATTNAQGDVMGLYTGSGTQCVWYEYDAWGNLVDMTDLSGCDIGTINPIRYRGYYYDTETGLYYLQSRYYDPEIGRFINADGVVSGIGKDVQGYNMYAYCFNNPVNMSDCSGNWPSWNDVCNWVNNNIIEPVKKFAEDVVEDLKNYDSNNQSEDVVFSSNYFSNYNGALVVKTPIDASFSFGVIGLSAQQQNTDTLKHEYGHTVQMDNIGIGCYITEVAIPSVTINLLERAEKLPYDYYSYPWEAEANKLGGTTVSQIDKPPLPEGGYTSYWDLIQLFFS